MVVVAEPRAHEAAKRSIPWFLGLFFLSTAWLLLAIVYLDNPNQHGGHRLPRYQKCMVDCEERCPAQQVWAEFGWTCADNCAHQCEVTDSEIRAAVQAPQIKYSRGRWAFYRIWYMEEFLSAVFSVLNGLPYVIYYGRGTCSPHSEHWLGSVLRVSAALHSITWLLSAMFHARPTQFLEHLDYLGVILTCLAELFTALLRVLDRREAAYCKLALAGGSMSFATYAVAMPLLNFRWQLQQLISQGLLAITAVLWMWYGVRERHDPLTRHLAMPWALLLFFCVLELVDFAPFSMPGLLHGIADSHCLWHLVTIPINAWIVYGWNLERRSRQKVSEGQLWKNEEQRVVIWSAVFLIIFSAAILPTWVKSGELCSSSIPCRQRLRSTWLGEMDLSDPQWRAFRENLPALLAAAIATTFLRRRYPHLKAAVAFTYCLALHGLSAVFFVALFLIAFYLRKHRTLDIGVCWSLALCLLYVKDMEWAKIPFPGLHDWRLVAKYAALRLVSMAAELQPEHTFWQAFDYFFHPALWLAGPIMSLDDFLASSTASLQFCVFHSVRLVGLFLLQEFVLALVPFFAILQAEIVGSFNTRSFASLLYAAVNGLWLKFSVMWRFFRVWALFDGVQAPENVPHCINTHRTLTGFWQSWHCSFNRWVVRHIYIPLGGRRNRFCSVWVIFLFSAYWHDVSSQNWQPLFLWGLLNVFHLSLEWLIQRWWSGAGRVRLSDKPWTQNCLQCAAGILTSASISVTTFVGVLGGQTFLRSFAIVLERSTNWALDAAGVALVLGCITQITMASEEVLAAPGKQN